MRKTKLDHTNLSSECITHLINNCTQLEELSLERYQKNNDGLTIAKAYDKLQNLKSLNVSLNRNLTDESCINIIRGCHNLLGIDIVECFKLTDASLISIANNCPNLQQLYFENYISFTNIGLNEP